MLNCGLLRGLRKGSARYEDRQRHLPEVLLMVDAFYRGFQEMERRLEQATRREPQVVLGTVKGDVHEIGKNLVRIVLETQGVRVLDLGATFRPRSLSRPAAATGRRCWGSRPSPASRGVSWAGCWTWPAARGRQDWPWWWAGRL